MNPVRGMDCDPSLFDGDGSSDDDGSLDDDWSCARVTHTMDLSVNLSNASHYDVNDACQGFSIWTEDKPGTTRNWYFVLPNVEGYFPNSDWKFSGSAIKLRHGVLISWDGRLIRHCTSLITSRAGNVFGSFLPQKTRIVKQGMKEALRASASGKTNVVIPELPVPVEDDLTTASWDDMSEEEEEEECDDESVDGGIEIADAGRSLPPSVIDIADVRENAQQALHSKTP